MCLQRYRHTLEAPVTPQMTVVLSQRVCGVKICSTHATLHPIFSLFTPFSAVSPVWKHLLHRKQLHLLIVLSFFLLWHTSINKPTYLYCERVTYTEQEGRMKKHILRLRYNGRYFIFHLHKSDIFILHHVGTVESFKNPETRPESRRFVESLKCLC